ncbi:MAG: PIG-L family deacetylase [Myxococcota bacterium]
MVWFATFGWSARATPPASEIGRELDHLRVVGSVLYVAAHPDDENTRLIGWLEGHGVRTAYLSLTRGDGGQNRIGTEQDELLGVLRTGELLAARGVDGGEQRFTRMRDFGYSKSAEEALALWGHDEALDDVVRAIRTFRPDVVVTRFPTTGDTHGHHLASAQLAHEAFAVAADPAYPTDGLAPWAAHRLVWNRSSWGLTPDTDTSAWGVLDTGGFDPATGRSYGELAAIARTNHKSQGFGSDPDLGPLPEYFVSELGAPVPAGQGPLHGLDLSWGRWPEAAKFDRAVARAIAAYDPRRPADVLSKLAVAHDHLADLPDPTWRAVATERLERVMANCAGLWLTARADRPAAAPGDAVPLTFTAVARGASGVTLRSVAVGPAWVDGAALAENVPWTHELGWSVPADAPFSRPHWLVEPGTRSRYTVAEPALRNAPEAPPAAVARFVVVLGGRAIPFDVPVTHAVVDPVQGERVAPFAVSPPVTATFDAAARVVDRVATTRLTLAATAGAVEGVLRLEPPPGVIATPSEVRFALPAGGERVVELALSVSPDAPAGSLGAVVEVSGVRTSLSQVTVDYPHLPRRTVLGPATQRIVPLTVDRGGVERVGYVAGTGDVVPEALRAMGYSVELLTDDQIAQGDLSRFDAVVTGVRAFNTRPRLFALNDVFTAYVAGGGHLVVQYVTSNGWEPLAGPVGPLPLTIGRGRVTDEAAALRALDPTHPVLTGPNPLGPADFDGWVQERGLYFAETWDPGYQPVFAARDPGEEEQLGSLLVAHHGSGVYVYTGLALFRQLPAGVPGAYRLLANLLATP